MAERLDKMRKELNADLRLKAHAGSGVIRALSVGESASVPPQLVQQFRTCGQVEVLAGYGDCGICPGIFENGN